jgi:hypothetical protein
LQEFPRRVSRLVELPSESKIWTAALSVSPKPLLELGI